MRRLLKRLVFGLCFVVLSPLLALTWLEKVLTRSEVVFGLLSQALALVPGLPGVWLRAPFYFVALERSSWEIHVGFGSIFTHRGAVLGRNVSMGSFCVIGHATIGDGCMMASRISIPSGKRQHLDESGQLTATPRFARVTIGERTWVGEGAIIMADVGRECIVSAGAVVVKEMPDACLIAGNPAQAVRPLQWSAAVAAKG
jgi:virginiamycin A acetyltransferase